MATKKLNIPGSEKGLTILRVPPAQITVNEVDNGRKYVSDDIGPLVDSLITAGRQLQPVGVRRTPDGGLLLVWGYRRWRALSYIVENALVQEGEPLSLLECIVMDKEMTEAEAFELNVLENTGRKDLTPIDIATNLSRSTTEFGKTLKAAAAPWNKSKAWASMMIRLLELPPQVQKKIDLGSIPVSAAYDVLTMPEGEDRDAAMAALEAGDGTTRSQVREAVRQRNIADTPEAPAEETTAPPAKPAKGDKKKRTLKELAVVVEGLKTKYTETSEDGTETLLPLAAIMDEFLRLMGGKAEKSFERSMLKILGV